MSINYDWVLGEWRRFVDMCERERYMVPPSKHPRLRFRVSEDDLAKQADVVRLSLNTVFPGSNFNTGGYGTFATQMLRLRELVMEAIPKVERADEIDANLGFADEGPTIAADSMHPWVWDAARPHWESGNHRAALLAAATNVNSRLHKKLGRMDVSEQKAIQQAFSIEQPEVDRPRLRLASRDDPDNFRSVHVGVMNFGCGLFGAVRNPVAHLADDDHDLDEREALESLAAFSLLSRWIDRADLEVFADQSGGDMEKGTVKVPTQTR